jgi:molecular chaperone GrpE
MADRNVETRLGAGGEPVSSRDPAGDVTPERRDDEMSELLEQLRRERADFLNYKRRVAEERSGDLESERGVVLTKLLPVLDDLERALGQIPTALEADAWVRGVGLLGNELNNTLAQLGLVRIGFEGDPFDPQQHEAILHDFSASAEDERIADVIRPGYALGSRLLRPAQVRVVGPLKPARESTEAEETELQE